MSKSANVVRMVVLATAVLALVVLPAGTARAADEKVSLTPKYLPGKYVTNMSINSESTVAKGDTETPGGKRTIEKTMEISISQPDTKGNKEMTMQFTKFKISMTISGQPETSYSSTKPSDENNEPWASVVKSLLAAKITATIAPDGSASNIKGFDEAFANITDDAASVAVKNQIKSFFGEDHFKEMIDSSRKLLPREPVAIGQIFKNTMPMKLTILGAVDLTFDGRILSIDKFDKGTLARVVFEVKIDKAAATTKPTTTAPVMENLKQFTITQEGMLIFNVDLGIATGQKTTQMLDMEMLVGKETTKVKETSKILVETTFTPAK